MGLERLKNTTAPWWERQLPVVSNTRGFDKYSNIVDFYAVIIYTMLNMNLKRINSGGI
jgi:hypothetical protein